MHFDLPESINFVLETLIKNGHKAYIVGGCVRDLLCKKTPNDYDITTSALPEQIKTLFEKTIATGLKHGTVTVIVNGEMIEVTTFRTEAEYKDSRHPEKVSFVTDVKADLARRDFTINAICYNHTEGIIDCFGGKNDINLKTLRAVGDAKTRFSEDALRILRLFRFAATLEFAIEENTLNAAIKCAPLLQKISAERIFAELKKLAVGNIPEAITPLLCANALSDYHLKQNDLSLIKPLEKSQNLRIFALLYLCSNNLQKTLNALKCSNSFKDYCKAMQHLIENKLSPNKIDIKQSLAIIELEVLNDALLYYRDVLKIDITEYQILINDIIKSSEPYKISHLKISGNDIVSLGFGGTIVGEKLELLLNKVIENPTLNNRQDLINLICN